MTASAGYVALALVLSACTAAADLTWTRIAPDHIQQPPGFMDVLQGADGNVQNTCAPCHPAVDTSATAVTMGPLGLVAVGWIFQGFHGIAWHSSDGSNWQLDEPLPEQTILSGVAADDRHYVAIGLDGQGATAWTSSDGQGWSKVTSPAFAASPLRMTSIVHWTNGFVIAGYEGAEVGAASPAFWTSPDGTAWQRATVVDGGGGRPAAVLAVTNGFIAVGSSDSTGTEAAAAWTSPDGQTWRRVPDQQAFAGIRLHGVAQSPIGLLVAVGETTNGQMGAVVTSTDGTSWTRANPSSDLGRTGIQVRINAVEADLSGFIAAGSATEGVQYGEAAAWTSVDGSSWSRVANVPEFADAEFLAMTRFEDRAVVVGDRGAPDTYIATMWLSPAR